MLQEQCEQLVVFVTRHTLRPHPRTATVQYSSLAGRYSRPPPRPVANPASRCAALTRTATTGTSRRFSAIPFRRSTRPRAFTVSRGTMACGVALAVDVVGRRRRGPLDCPLCVFDLCSSTLPCLLCVTTSLQSACCVCSAAPPPLISRSRRSGPQRACVPPPSRPRCQCSEYNNCAQRARKT